MRRALAASAPELEPAAERDRAIRAMIHAHFERAHAAPTILARLRPRRAVIAAAAALLLIVTLPAVLALRDTAPAIAGDLDRNGVVDMRDAWRLATALEHDGAAPPGADVTGDGTIDRADVAWLAARAVALPGSGATEAAP